MACPALQHMRTCMADIYQNGVIGMAVALQAHLLRVTELCVHAGLDPLELDPAWLPYLAQMDQVCSTCAHSTCADWLYPCH